MAHIVLAGNISRDVEISTVGGVEVASFSIPDNEFRNGATLTTWFNCSVWEPRDFVKRLKKGDNIRVAGSFAPRRYTNKDGVEGVSYDVRVYGDSVQFNAGNRPKADAPATDDGDDAPF